MSEITEEKERTLCSCIYSVLIEEENDCMLDLSKSLDLKDGDIDKRKFYSRDLQYADDLINIIGLDVDDEFISETYSRLCLLTNEELNIDNNLYFRVHRVIFNEQNILDLNKVRDLTNITVWSNGKNNINNSKFLFYWKGKRLRVRNDCPPSTSSIIEAMQNTNIIDPEFESLKENKETCKLLYSCET